MELKSKVKVEISARHIHLSQKDLEKLFGEGAVLHPVKALGQPGDYACEERVDIVTSTGSIKIRALAPLRNQTQIELAPADARKIGLDPPVRHSGDLAGTPGVTVVGPKGRIELPEGVIIASRHIHLDPATAQMMSVKDKDLVNVRIVGKRSVVLENVLIRVNKNYAPSMHIDTDEGNACLAENGDMVELILTKPS
jgi:putative phosphotransacetylase